jgi:DNA-directed RNA polymerase specialized sigma24 family protein
MSNGRFSMVAPGEKQGAAAPAGEPPPVPDPLIDRSARMARAVGLKRGVPAGDLDALVQEVRARARAAEGEGKRAVGAPSARLQDLIMAAAFEVVRAHREPAPGTVAGDPPSGQPAVVPDRFEAEAVSQKLVAAVARLRGAQGAVVRLHLAGYDKSEIADLLGSSPAGVNRSLYRGMGQLRAFLGGGGRSHTDVQHQSRLRTLYSRVLASRRPQGRDRCLSPDELLELLRPTRLSETDRIRLVEHLTDCAACHQEFSLLRTANDATTDRRKAPRVGWFAPAAALCVALAVAVLWQVLPQRGRPPANAAVSGPELIEPGGTVGPGQPLQFVWHDMDQASEYVLEVLSLDGTLVASRRTADTTALLPAGASLTPGRSYHWWVRALMADGRQVVSTAREITEER